MRLAPKSTSTRALIAAVVATALTVSGCNSGGTSTGGATIVSMQVTSSAFG
jgi:hypothetical protein